MARMFLTTVAACAAPGLAALRSPVSAMSPTAKKCGYFSSRNCIVGRMRTNPLEGLRSPEEGDEEGRPERRSLLGVWPVARMTKSYCEGRTVPSVSWTVKGAVCGKPDSGTFTREPVMNLIFTLMICRVRREELNTHLIPNSSNRSLISSCNRG